MSTIAPAASVVINGRVRIPAGIADLDSFRRWLHSDDFPERARITYLAGPIWVELSEERAFSHNDVRHEVAGVLRSLTRISQTGRYFGGGMRLSIPAANLSADPDGMFASYASFHSGRIHRIPNAQNFSAVELVGTPDMVLEVVSDSSVGKDTVELPPLYLSAGIPEFWRIDVRRQVQFEILRLTAAGWELTQLADGWWRSGVFGRDFRLLRSADPLGEPDYTLEARPATG